MHTFSQVFPQKAADVAGIVSGVRCPSLSRVEELLAKSRSASLDLPELAELLEIGRSETAHEQFAALGASVLERWRRPEGNAVRYVAPIYVSSFCIDQCAYCNFSALRTATVRRRLSLDELDGEIAAVLDRGARIIELVYATDPEFTTDLLVRYVERVAEALRGEPGAGVLLCTEYLSQEAYEALRAAGLLGIVQWDETLDAQAYERWHASSPHKREFRLRMDNHDRAAAAGLTVAIGALFGLADYRYDALMQVAKARHLEAEYGRGPFVLGVPRLKPIAGHELHFQTEVSDRAYETILQVYRLAAPEAGRWLQTRETFEMNLRNLLDGDVFTYRCGDVTPGGYHQVKGVAPAVKGGQFGVNELDRDYVEGELASRGFHIDYTWGEGCQAAVAR
jgi:2-iminoacetate synthase